ncbi:MAG: hypothetical protein QM710_09785 [Flavobacterium sp.]
MKKTLCLFLLGITNLTMAQDSLKVADKKQPILFYDAYVGFANGIDAGWTAGVTLNYQFFKATC